MQFRQADSQGSRTSARSFLVLVMMAASDPETLLQRQPTVQAVLQCYTIVQLGKFESSMQLLCMKQTKFTSPYSRSEVIDINFTANN